MLSRATTGGLSTPWPSSASLFATRCSTPGRSAAASAGRLRPDEARLPFWAVSQSPAARQLSPLRAVTEDGNLAEDVFDAADLRTKGALWEGVIKRYNQGGVIVAAGGQRGFCPYSRLDPTRLEGVSLSRTKPTDASSLLNQPIKCLVHELDDRNRPILSEQAYFTQRALNHYKPRDVIEGQVVGMQQYGVFVTVPSEDGVYRGVRGLIHTSELSWDVVTRPESIVQIGDTVNAFVKSVKKESNRIELSLRHVESDPLKESISSLLPLEGEAYDNMTWEQPESLLPELNVILETLRVEPGIEDVRPSRQAEVQHKVSLDLEIWLSKEEVTDGFNLVAWSGRTLQEIHIQTQLSRDEIKDTLRGVIKRTM